VLNPVPIAPTFNDNTDLTIAVNLGGALKKIDNKTIKSEQQGDEEISLQKSIRRFIQALQKTGRKDHQQNWGK
jgi:NTE family protein